MLILVPGLKDSFRTNFKSVSLFLVLASLVLVLVLVLEGSVFVLAGPVLENSLLEDLKILNCSHANY